MWTYPASRAIANVNTIRKTTREQAEAWLNQGLKRIEALANERKSREPQTTSEQPTASGQATGIQETAEKGGQILPPPIVPLPAPAPVVDEKTLQDDYAQGMSLLEGKEYDQAIERFTTLLKTSYEGKARSRIEEAAKLGAQEDRQKAADLFVRSSSTRDPENKKKLLLSSRELLKGILVKYPQSGLADKVQRNLSRIEEELKALGSASASTSSSPAIRGGAYVPPQSPARPTAMPNTL